MNDEEWIINKESRQQEDRNCSTLQLLSSIMIQWIESRILCKIFTIFISYILI